jgi:hypothetical protein
MKFTKQLLLAALALGFVAAAGAWQGPTQPAPQGNVPAPVNVGKAAQSKEGTLGVGGLGVFGRGFFSTGAAYALPANLQLGVNGAVGASQYCDETGTRCITVDEIMGLVDTDTDTDTDTNGRITCPAGAAFQSTVEARPKFDGSRIAIPSHCATDEGCVIKQVIYNKKNNAVAVWDTRYVDFRQTSIQDGATSDWWSSYTPTGRAKNGDGIRANIVPALFGKDNKYYQIAILDDYGTEKSAAYVTMYDDSPYYGQDVWFCSYGPL